MAKIFYLCVTYKSSGFLATTYQIKLVLIAVLQIIKQKSWCLTLYKANSHQIQTKNWNYSYSPTSHPHGTHVLEFEPCGISNIVSILNEKGTLNNSNELTMDIFFLLLQKGKDQPKQCTGGRDQIQNGVLKMLKLEGTMHRPPKKGAKQITQAQMTL